ncbi:MAG TPA: hypothetical protein VI546_07390 [candidate division Zixibacteria bacterium]|nr:hypothetical protein [candidate division Zixibacteria bacterium]
MRKIDHILHFRADISSFLVHLTRSIAGVRSGKEALLSILREKKLICGSTQVSDARFGRYTLDMTDEDRKLFFSAICFTETPLNEIHCLLEIAYRQIDLEPYGLVFLKERLQDCGISPVLYLNNEQGDKDPVIRSLCSLIDTQPEPAAKFLPLLAVFGQKLTAPGALPSSDPKVDFRWEGEWRLPSVNGSLQFDLQDVFIGLCPHDEIDEFEAILPPLKFVDPTRNMKWYATKLIEARQRLDIKFLYSFQTWVILFR